MKPIILTGDRPTGKLHLGHYVGSLQNRVKLQNDYNQFVMIADIQGLTDNTDNPSKIQENITEVALDYLAVGIDPQKTTIFVQSLIPELAELTVYFLNLVTLARLQRNPTVKTEMKQKQMTNNIPVGFLVYPISQAADILAFKAHLVPVGKDQLPMLEQTNEIALRFNKLYSPRAVFFNTVKPLLSESTSLLPGIDGKTKMSKSLNNAIYLSSTDEEIEKSVMSMYTDSKHLKITDPGHIKGNTVFTYLDIFDPNKNEISKLKKQYQAGGLGDVVLKKRLIQVLIDLIKPVRQRREALSKDKTKILNMLKDGSANARKVAQKTLAEVRNLIHFSI